MSKGKQGSTRTSRELNWEVVRYYEDVAGSGFLMVLLTPVGPEWRPADALWARWKRIHRSKFGPDVVGSRIALS